MSNVVKLVIGLAVVAAALFGLGSLASEEQVRRIETPVVIDAPQP